METAGRKSKAGRNRDAAAICRTARIRLQTTFSNSSEINSSGLFCCFGAPSLPADKKAVPFSRDGCLAGSVFPNIHQLTRCRKVGRMRPAVASYVCVTTLGKPPTFFPESKASSPQGASNRAFTNSNAFTYAFAISAGFPPPRPCSPPSI